MALWTHPWHRFQLAGMRQLYAIGPFRAGRGIAAFVRPSALCTMLPILICTPACPALAASTGLCYRIGWEIQLSARTKLFPSQLAGSRVAMTTGNWNKSNSPLLPVAESLAVSVTEEMIVCLSWEILPSCVGATVSKEVSSHQQRRGTAQSFSAGKVTAPEAWWAWDCIHVCGWSFFL